MGRFLKSPLGVKGLRTYTLEEVASACKVHKNTVGRWDKEGLRPCNMDRPKLYRGSDVRSFLEARARRRRAACASGEMFCMRCRAPSKILADAASLRIMSNAFGLLSSVCGDCGARMSKFIAPKKLQEIRDLLRVSSEGTSTINSSEKFPL
jgi:hypothetical protein